MSSRTQAPSQYAMIIRWTDEESAFVALVPELPGVSGVGATREEAAAEAEVAAGLAVEVLRADGRAAPPASILQGSSGQFRVRLPRSLHRDLVALAEAEGVSLNTLLVKKLAESVAYAKREPAPPPASEILRG